MTIQDKAKVGNKGEILPKKTLREVSGFKPGDILIIEASLGKMTIKKVYTAKELVELPIITRKTAEEYEEMTEEEMEEQEKLMDA